jgi:hypothetical protein
MEYLNNFIIPDISLIIIEYIKTHLSIIEDHDFLIYKINDYKFNIEIGHYNIPTTFWLSPNDDIKFFDIKQNIFLNDHSDLLMKGEYIYFNENIVNYLLKLQVKTSKNLEFYNNKDKIEKIDMIGKYIPASYCINNYINNLNILLCDDSIIISIKYPEFLFNNINILLSVINEKFVTLCK